MNSLLEGGDYKNHRNYAFRKAVFRKASRKQKNHRDSVETKSFIMDKELFNL
jgi:hypothetical protein